MVTADRILARYLMAGNGNEPPKTAAERVTHRYLTATALAISPELERAIDTVAGFLKGSRKAKFEKGLGVLRASIAQGQWVPRGKATVLAAVSQGLVKGKQLPVRHSYAPEAAVISNPAWDEYNELERSLEFGHDYRGKHTIPAALIKIPEHVQRAWFEVCIGVEVV